MIWQVLKWISKILFIDTEQLAKMSSSSHVFFKDFFERLRATYFKNWFFWEFCWLISDWKKTESSQKYSWRILIIAFKASMTKNTSFKGALTKILNVLVLYIYIPSHTELSCLLKSPQISSNLKLLKSPLISKNIDFQVIPTHPEEITFKKGNLRTINWKNKIIKIQSLPQEPIIVCMYGFFICIRITCSLSSYWHPKLVSALS